MDGKRGPQMATFIKIPVHNGRKIINTATIEDVSEDPDGSCVIRCRVLSNDHRPTVTSQEYKVKGVSLDGIYKALTTDDKEPTLSTERWKAAY
jgi:hypothetical protein